VRGLLKEELLEELQAEIEDATDLQRMLSCAESCETTLDFRDKLRDMKRMLKDTHDLLKRARAETGSDR
jgi:hypothetical protein